MQWQRLEEGEMVTVTLERTAVLPQTPADLIQGLWLLTPTQQNQLKSTAKPAYVFMRWDRLFNFRGFPSGFSNGHWHMDGHQPLLTLMADGKEEKWRVEVQPTTMTWTKADTTGPQEALHFTRTDTFPE